MIINVYITFDFKIFNVDKINIIGLSILVHIYQNRLVTLNIYIDLVPITLLLHFQFYICQIAFQLTINAPSDKHEGISSKVYSKVNLLRYSGDFKRQLTPDFQSNFTN